MQSRNTKSSSALARDMSLIEKKTNTSNHAFTVTLSESHHAAPAATASSSHPCAKKIRAVFVRLSFVIA